MLRHRLRYSSFAQQQMAEPAQQPAQFPPAGLKSAHGLLCPVSRSQRCFPERSRGQSRHEWLFVRAETSATAVPDVTPFASSQKFRDNLTGKMGLAEACSQGLLQVDPIFNQADQPGERCRTWLAEQGPHHSSSRFLYLPFDFTGTAHESGQGGNSGCPKAPQGQNRSLAHSGVPIAQDRVEERDDAGGIHNDLPQHFHGSAAKLGQGKLQRRPEVEDRIRALFRGRLGCRLANQEGPVVHAPWQPAPERHHHFGGVEREPSRWPPGQSRQGRARPSGAPEARRQLESPTPPGPVRPGGASGVPRVSSPG